MNVQTPNAAERAEKLQGLGSARKRVQGTTSQQFGEERKDNVQTLQAVGRRFEPVIAHHDSDTGETGRRRRSRHGRSRVDPRWWST